MFSISDADRTRSNIRATGILPSNKFAPSPCAAILTRPLPFETSVLLSESTKDPL